MGGRWDQCECDRSGSVSDGVEFRTVERDRAGAGVFDADANAPVWQDGGTGGGVPVAGERHGELYYRAGDCRGWRIPGERREFDLAGRSFEAA